MKDSKLVYHSSVHKWPDGAKAARIDTELLDQTAMEANKPCYSIHSLLGPGLNIALLYNVKPRVESHF